MNPSHPHHGGDDLRGRKFYPPRLPARSVERSIPCVRCKYNLKTLHHHWRCPECGLMVDWSLAKHAAGRTFPRRPFVAAGATLASLLVLHSVDAGGSLYTPAVVFFAASLAVDLAMILEHLGRTGGSPTR